MIALAGRLAELDAIHLMHGGHSENTAREMCAMEAVAYVAGEPWSDHPSCASPILGAFMRAWNDGLPTDEARDRLLKPFVPQLVDSKASDEIETRRSFMALDWLIRVHTPKWLDLVPSLADHAKSLRDLEEIADMAGATAASEKVRAAWDAVRVAAGDAVRDAVRVAAWDVAWAAARAAAGDAARAAAGDAVRDAAWDTVRVAAWAAAWAAARAAAGDAAWDALKPTKEWLQASATDLLTRMIYIETRA
jgi:hypothetical protein